MKMTLCILFLGIMVGFVGLQSAQCETTIINGVEVDEFGLPVSIDSVSAPLDEPNLLSFDPPCLFVHAIPVPKNSYKYLGFSHKGNGAVVNECGNWTAATGFTGPNFLGFNCGATLANGKVPFLPEKFTFSQPMTRVSFTMGGIPAGEHLIVSVNKKLLNWDVQLSSTGTIYTISYPEPTIKTLEFKVPEGSSACVLYIDNIQLTP
jgi:hypothetical protein